MAFQLGRSTFNPVAVAHPSFECRLSTRRQLSVIACTVHADICYSPISEWDE